MKTIVMNALSSRFMNMIHGHLLSVDLCHILREFFACTATKAAITFFLSEDNKKFRKLNSCSKF